MGLGVRIVLAAAPAMAGVVAARAADYPAAALRGIAASCAASEDVPPAASPAFCRCYVGRVQQTIAWADWRHADAALAASGASGLGPADKAVFATASRAATACYGATVR